MSTGGSGITSKGESKTKDSSNNVSTNNSISSVSKASFATLNINNLYRGKSLEQSPKPTPKHGMQTIGKLGNIRRINNPSSSSSSLSSLSSLSTLTKNNQETKSSSSSDNKASNGTVVDKNSSSVVGGSSIVSSSQSSSSSKWLNNTDTSSASTAAANNTNSQAKLDSTCLPSRAGLPKVPSWSGSQAPSIQDAFPALGSEPPPPARQLEPRHLQAKPILPPAEFPELGASLKETSTEAKCTSTKQTEAPPVSLPTQPTTAVASDASYGPGPALRPPPLNWNQRNNAVVPTPLGMNGSLGQGVHLSGSTAVGNVTSDGRGSFAPHLHSSFPLPTAPPNTFTGNRGATTILGSSQFAAQRSGYHGGGAHNPPNLGSQQDFRGSRPKSAKEEVPTKFKGSIIPSEKISEFDEILEKGEMKIDWTTACDDIDYDEDLNFDLDDTSKKSTPKKLNEESKGGAPAKVSNRHPSFEDEFSRGDSNPSARILYDPRDERHKSSKVDAPQRPRRDSRSLSEKSDEPPFLRDNRNRGLSGDSRDLRSAPSRQVVSPASQPPQLAPRFQKQIQGQSQGDPNNRRQPQPEQKRSGLTSLGSVKQRPIPEVNREQPPPPPEPETRQPRPRNDSQSKVHEHSQKELYADRWRSTKPSKGDDLNWRSQTKKHDQSTAVAVEEKRPTESQQEVVVLKHDPPKVQPQKNELIVKKEAEVVQTAKTEPQNIQRTQIQPNIQSTNTGMRTIPPAPPGLQQPSRVRQEDQSSWRTRNETGGQNRRQDLRQDVNKMESFRTDQSQGRFDDRRREDRRDPLESSRQNSSSAKRDERSSDREIKDFPINNWTNPVQEAKKEEVRTLEKRTNDLSLSETKSTVNVNPVIRNVGSVFNRDDPNSRATSEEPKSVRAEPAFKGPSNACPMPSLPKGIPESVLKTSGPLLARVLTGTSYGPPASKPAFETLSKPLSQSSSLEHQDSGVDVGPDHTSAASSQRSSPNNNTDKAKTNKVLPGNSSLIGKSVEESAEHPKGIVIFENKNLRAENAALEKSHGNRGQPNDNIDPRRRIPPPFVEEKNRPGFPVKSMQSHNVSVRELGQDLDQKIASVRKVWDDTTPPPVAVSSMSEDKMTNVPSFSGETRKVQSAEQAAAVAAIRGLVNEALVRQHNQQQHYRRSSSGQIIPNSSSPPVHHQNVDSRQQQQQQQQQAHPGCVSTPPVNMFPQHQGSQPALSQTALANMAASMAAANQSIQAYNQFSPQLHAFAQQMAQFNQRVQHQQQAAFHSGLAGSVPVAIGSHDHMHRINPAGTIGHPHVASNAGHNDGHNNSDSNDRHLAVGAQLMKQQQQQLQQQNVYPTVQGLGFYSNSPSFYSHSNMTQQHHPNQGYSGSFAAAQGINPGILSSSMSSEQHLAANQLRTMMPIARSQNNRPF